MQASDSAWDGAWDGAGDGIIAAPAQPQSQAAAAGMTAGTTAGMTVEPSWGRRPAGGCVALRGWLGTLRRSHLPAVRVGRDTIPREIRPRLTLRDFCLAREWLQNACRKD
jgi:hypothetical protein